MKYLVVFNNEGWATDEGSLVVTIDRVEINFEACKLSIRGRNLNNPTIFTYLEQLYTAHGFMLFKGNEITVNSQGWESFLVDVKTWEYLKNIMDSVNVADGRQLELIGSLLAKATSITASLNSIDAKTA